jgi:hypothetical protein
MKVLDDASRGASPGTRLALQDLGLPGAGTNGLLIVFWNSR